MEFCGGHTHAISRYGVKDLLPPNVVMVHGPGCPVCVLPIGRIDMAIDLAMAPSPSPLGEGPRERAGRVDNITLCTYADTMRVPASNGLSLMKAKAQGADIRMVYSAADALRIAREEPEREVVFFAIGFETTTPPTALVVKQAARAGARELQRLREPRAHALGHRAHPRVPGGARPGHRGDRRLRGPGARLHHHRQPALRVLRRGVPQARGHRRLRAAGRDAGHRDAGAAGERGPRRGGERVLARRDPRGQRQGEGAGGRRLRAAPRLRVARPGPGALQRA